MNCECCQSPVHIWFDCPKKPVGWKPARLAKSTAVGNNVATQPRANNSVPSDGAISTAATKVSPQAAIAKRGLTSVSVNAVADLEGETTQIADTQSPPVDTNRGRSSVARAGVHRDVHMVEGAIPSVSTKFDKKAWMREYMRGYMRNRRAKK